MAIDDALVDSVRDGGGPVLRLYGWSPPCLSLGRNQPARGAYDREALRTAGIEVVRRSTGGRAVLHDRELTYAVVAPSRWFGSARRAYTAINECLVAALASLGARATVVARVEASPFPSTTPCFAEPVTGEIAVRDRKLVGSAQRVEGGALLQHGSIPLGRSPALDLLPRDLAASLDGHPAYLESILGGPVDPGILGNAIASSWETAIGPLESAGITPAEANRADRLEAGFRDDAWTWRR
jgi:lipoyl(octanoyl) transferase